MEHVGALTQQVSSLSTISSSTPTLASPLLERRVHFDVKENESNGRDDCSEDDYTDASSVSSDSSILHWRVKDVYLARGMDTNDGNLWKGKIHEDTKNLVRNRRRIARGKEITDGDQWLIEVRDERFTSTRSSRRRRQRPRKPNQ